MFQLEITSIQEDIAYHEKELELAKARLDNIEVATEYSTNALASIEDCLSHIEPSFLGILKDRIDQMFSDNSKDGQEGRAVLTTPGVPEPVGKQEVKEETPQEIIEEEPLTKEVEKTEKEFGPLSYHELTGTPDLRPDTFEDLAPNLTYSSSGRAYVGFSDKEKAEEFLNNISEPAMIGEENTMNGFKYEVKFYCDREYVQEIANSINSMSEDVEEVQTPNIEKIDGSLVYSHADSICYVAGKSKGRLDNYGSYLTRILDIGDKYTVSKEPSFFETKYELRVEGISFDDSFHLQNFNLLKEYDVKENEGARKVWRDRIRKYETSKPRPKALDIADVKFGAIVSTSADDISKKQYKVLSHKELNGEQHLEVICIFNKEMPALVNICSWLKEVYPVPVEAVQIDPQFNPTNFQKEEAKPVLKEVKKSDRFTENDFPAGPYNKIGLEELEFGDIITSSPNSKSAYEVISHEGEFVRAVCLYNLPLPKRVGEEYPFITPFLVEKATEEVAVDGQRPLAPQAA